MGTSVKSGLTNDQNETIEEVSLKDIIIKVKKGYSYLLTKWVIILTMAFVGSLLGFLYSFYKKPIYTASTTFVLEDAGGGGVGGLGQYSGLASMVGVDIGGSSSGIFSGDNILELYRSKIMIQSALLSEYTLDGKTELLINRYINYNHLKDKAKKIDPKTFIFKKDQQVFTIEQNRLIAMIVNTIRKNYLSVNKIDKKLSIIDVTVQSQDEVFAKEFSDQIVRNVNRFYVETKTKKSAQNLSILQHQSDSIRASLNGAISETAIAMDVNPNPNPSRQILRAPSQRRQVDVEANKAILTELVKNLEISKISLRKETPLIQVIDKPVYPLDETKLSKLIGIITGGLIAGILTVIILSIRKLYKLIIN